MAEPNLVERANEILARLWVETVNAADRGELIDALEEKELIEAVRRCINSNTKTYRYVLPTQLVAKLADHTLDCRCLQMSRGGAGAFDARTIAHQVVVPFDRANESVLGGAPEPYVNNPLRIHEVSEKYRDAQKNKAGWQDLCRVLGEVETRNAQHFTENVLQKVLGEIYKRLATVKVTYPVPRRISLDKAVELIEQFSSERSGGDRFEAVTAALFLTVGKQFGMFCTVRRTKVTGADASSGMVADIECLNETGDVVMAVEAKDRDVTVRQLQDKIPGLREHKVSEAFFVAGRGIAMGNEQDVRGLIANEFVSGQNIYVMELLPLASVILALVGEPGRRVFLEEVGTQLDQYSDVPHRRRWAQRLQDV